MDIIEHLTDRAGEVAREFGRPLVTLSYAQSLDGSIAARPGTPLALSGPEAMALTHRIRSQHDAILVGIGTVLADNPRLTVRLFDGPNPQPVVLDSRLRFPLDAHLLSGPERPWITALPGSDPVKRQELKMAGARVFEIPPGEDGHLSIPGLLKCLAGEGVKSLMVEGGAEVIASFLGLGLVDQVLLTIAPMFVGGLHAPGRLPGNAMVRLAEMQVLRLGKDLIVYGKPESHVSESTVSQDN